MTQETKMRKALIATIMLCVTFVGNHAVAQTDNSKYLTKTETYLDTAAIRQSIEEAKQTLGQRRQDLQKMKDAYELKKADFEFMYDNRDKKAETEHQQQLLNDALKAFSHVGNSAAVKKAEKKVAKGIIAKELSYYYSKSYLEKDREKLSELESTLKEHEGYLKNFEQSFTYYKEPSGTLFGLDENFKQFSYNDLNNYWKKTVDIVIASTNRTENYIVTDGKRIPNQNSWLWLSYKKSYEWQDSMKMEMAKDWEWAINTLGRKEVHQSFPIKVSYYTSAEHPEYAVKQDEAYYHNMIVYTKEGQLVRVVGCPRADEEVLKIYLYRKDYEANKYNIKERSTETQNYIKRQLGYQTTQTAKEKARDAEVSEAWGKVNQAVRAQKSANTRREYYEADQAAKQAGLAAGLAMIAGAGLDQDGRNYMNQLAEDHRGDFEHAYYYERIDDTSFKVKLTGKEKGFVVKVTYIQDGPFNAEAVTTFLSEDEPMNIDDFKN